MSLRPPVPALSRAGGRIAYSAHSDTRGGDAEAVARIADRFAGMDARMSTSDVVRVVGVTRSTLFRCCKRGSFPRSTFPVVGCAPISRSGLRGNPNSVREQPLLG